MGLSMQRIVDDFAAAFQAVDSTRPIYVSRTGRVYQPGLGPHSEDAAVRLVFAEMQKRAPELYGVGGQGLPYPGSRERCDLFVGRPAVWAIEIKMARFHGDNGKQDDTSIKDILSPYDTHRSAVTDCAKLAQSELAEHRAAVIYGFEHASMPLTTIVDAFECLATRFVDLGSRATAPLRNLVHPVHSRGAVFGWEVLGRKVP